MVDRTARDRLAETIAEFLAEEIRAFEFHDRINDVGGETADKTVHEITLLLWHHYDDVKDHTAALSHMQWDYFQRLLLVLRSDSSLRSELHHLWTGRQAIAFAAIVAFVVGVFLLGFGWKLLLVTIPLGVISMGLSRWPTREAETDTDDFVRLTPYSSVSELLAVHRTVPGFRKRRYPEAMRSRRIRGPIANGLMTLQAGAMWLIFSPVVLIFQTLPQAKNTFQVVPA